MIKASAGGGGRGIRIAETVEALGAALHQAAAEAKAAFGDGGLYLEKFIGNARHIEVQILGDGMQFTAMSGNARCSGDGKKSGKKRQPRCFRSTCEKRFAPRPSPSPNP